MVSVPQWKAEQTRVPKFFLFVDDLKRGYPSAMVIDYGVPDTTDVVWVTAPNAFAAETKALDKYRAEQAKKSNKNKGSGTVDALPKSAIIKE